MDAHSIIIVDREAQVALHTPHDSGWIRRDLRVAGRWPAWNPVHDLVAVSVVEPRGDAVRSAIELVDLDGQVVRTAHETAPGVAPVIAPRVPHYALWSPGGDILSYVSQSTFGLGLFLTHADGSFVSDPIITGAPLFQAWCPDNNFLAVHAGPELSVVEVDGSRSTASVAERAAGFRAPAYSDDAEVLAYAVPIEGGTAVMRALFQGTGSREAHRFAGGVALGFRPGTDDLSVAVTGDPESGSFDELWTLPPEEGVAPHRIWHGPFVSFIWAPDGSRVAVVVPTQSGDGRYAIQLVTPDGHYAGATEGFVPSGDMRIYFGFFDQYSQSHSLWSADSTRMVLAGRLVSDTVHTSFGDAAGDYVMTWEAERGGRLERVAPGELGFYRPKAKTVIR
ncbi:MAG: hypothetical protein HY875_03165 [Chloroflexi bacterium]|nr:hypothetical protein [Chloroflexota bacterium]